jgi:hypothetical protein
MHDCTAIAATWERAAVHLPIGRMRVVPPGDDPWLVDGYMRLGRSQIEPCDPVDRFVSRLTQTLHDNSDAQYETSAIGWRDTGMRGAMCGSPE